MAFGRQRGEDEDEEHEAYSDEEGEGKGLGKTGGERAAAHLASSARHKHVCDKERVQKEETRE